MTPTREDLIRVLTVEPQLGIAALVERYGAPASEILSALQRHGDFERCPPRPQDGAGFAWRLSLLAADLTVRQAAVRHQRAPEQPPQMRAMTHSSLPRPGSIRCVLLGWLAANPGEWTLAQIAQGRGVTIQCVRAAVRLQAAHLTRRHQETKGRPLLVSLKPS